MGADHLIINPSIDPYPIPGRNDVLDESFIERAIVRSFMIDLLQMISVKAALSKQFSIPPSEVDKMRYWEYELWMEELNRLVKEENDKQEDEMKKSGVKDQMNKAQKMQKNYSNPSIGSYPQPKIPNINPNMPKF